MRKATTMSKLSFLPGLDSTAMAVSRRQELSISRDVAAALGRSAVQFARQGYYVTESGRRVDWRDAVETARAAKISIPPHRKQQRREQVLFPETRVQVSNETTLGAAFRLVEAGLKPLALNFASGTHPGGGFLQGARAQEESLCRSSALYQTLVGDPMYAAHCQRRRPDSTNWAILSPDVPVFRKDDGTTLEHFWRLSFLTCAAPNARAIGQPRARALLQRRIFRILSIAQSKGFGSLVLGAWGCGAFGNNPHRTALDFREALESDFSGMFSDIVFAIADWSPERRFLGPLRDVFSAAWMGQKTIHAKEPTGSILRITSAVAAGEGRHQ